MCYGVNSTPSDTLFETEKSVDESRGCGYCRMVAAVDACDLVLAVVVTKCVKEKEGCTDTSANNVGARCSGSPSDTSDDDCDPYTDTNTKGARNAMKVASLETTVCKDGCTATTLLAIGDTAVDFGEMVHVPMKVVTAGSIKLSVAEHV